MASKYEIVSKEYRSNCMVEAIKAKIRNPKVKIYFCKPIIKKRSFSELSFYME